MSPYNSSVSSHCHPNHSHAQSSPSVNWFKVNQHHISSYCNHLSSSIPEFPNDILNCCDPDCTVHHVDLDSYCVQLINCIESSAVLCLPTQGHCLRYAPLSGWNRSAHTLKQSAQFWHKVWSDCGCPTSGVLFQIKKNSKRRFKYEVRRLCRRRNYIQRENLATAISYSNPQEFWKQVKKLSKPSSGAMSSSSIIDGCNNDIEISNIFASKLESLLNSVPDTSRTNLQHQVKESITPSALSSVFITQEIVYDAISQLNRNKNDGPVLSSNHFIYAKEVLSTPLSKLFTAVIRHGTVPTPLRDCILVPIPKPGKDPSCSDNYCPIALAPTLSKVFEWCLLFKFQSCFVTSSLQFGFKPGFSSDLCTGLLKNVIHKYLVNNSHVYGCFLDASKAFDRVDHSLLFEKLLNRDLPPVIARLLLSWYSSQQLKVRWAKTFSNCFHTTNGVRQGGVLSPILFTVYIDDLLIAFESCGIGCFWKHHFVGAVCYADDISLLAPSPSALRYMLDTCLSFAIQHHLTFNPDKTQLIKFYKCADAISPRFTFLGQSLSLRNSVNHLGHILTHNLSDSEDISSITKDLCRKANCMLHLFACCDPLVKTRLFSSFCLSLYGAALWKSSDPQLKTLEVTFNNLLRKIWSLPRHSHTGLLHSTAKLQSIYNVVIFRSAKLLASASGSSSSLISDLFSESARCAYTFIGYNSIYGYKHLKTYSQCDRLCGSFIRDARNAPELNRHLEDDIYYISTV